MSTFAEQPQTHLVNYQLRLPGYEGPLDVLLRLIERNHLEITDVSLVAVTSQFLAFVDGLSEAPPSVIASFAAVGTRLAVLKSRSLLPRPATPTDDDEPSDLTQQLLEYRRAKDASAFLGKRVEMDLRSWGRPDTIPVDPELRRSSERLAHYPASSLVSALRRRLTIVPKPARVIPARRIVSLRDTVDRILDLTRVRRSVHFSDVVASYVSRTEVATAFLGTLVLVRRNVVAASQSNLFDDIRLERTGSANAAGDIHERIDVE